MTGNRGDITPEDLAIRVRAVMQALSDFHDDLLKAPEGVTVLPKSAEILLEPLGGGIDPGTGPIPLLRGGECYDLVVIKEPDQPTEVPNETRGTGPDRPASH